MLKREKSPVSLNTNPQSYSHWRKNVKEKTKYYNNEH